MPNHTRSLAEILGEMKNELQDFVQTRIELLRQELRDRMNSLKSAVPLGLAGVLLVGTGFLVFSFGIVALLAAFFSGSAYSWFIGAMIVAFLWFVGGVTSVFLAKARLSKQPMLPQKTMQVLSGDKKWIKKEAQNTL